MWYQSWPLCFIHWTARKGRFFYCGIYRELILPISFCLPLPFIVMRMATSVMHTSLTGTGETFASSPNTLYLIPHVVPKVYEHLLCALHQEQRQKGTVYGWYHFFPHTFISQGLLDSKIGAHSKEGRLNSVFSPSAALRNRDLPLVEKESKGLERLGTQSWSVRIPSTRVECQA